MADEKITGMYELLDALEAVIKGAEPAKREALAQTIDAYREDFPHDFFWAIGPQAPSLLDHLMTTIDIASRSEDDNKLQKARIVRLVDRKPEGNA